MAYLCLRHDILGRTNTVMAIPVVKAATINVFNFGLQRRNYTETHRGGCLGVFFRNITILVYIILQILHKKRRGRVFIWV